MIANTTANIDEIAVALREAAEGGVPAELIGSDPLTAAARDAIAALTAARFGDGATAAGNADARFEDVSNAIDAATTHIRSLESAARAIEGVVNDIDGIAQQTSLLSVNAGVEAARAGVAGAAFGIVAQEVRVLADRSGALTRDIRGRVDAMRTETAAVAAAVQSSGQAVRKLGAQLD